MCVRAVGCERVRPQGLSELLLATNGEDHTVVPAAEASPDGLACNGLRAVERVVAIWIAHRRLGLELRGALVPGHHHPDSGRRERSLAPIMDCVCPPILIIADHKAHGRATRALPSEP